MKTTVLLLLSLSGFMHNAISQTATPVNIDFKNKSITMPGAKTMKKTKSVYFIIDSIATGTYKISINKKDSIISVGNPPALFGLLSFADGFNTLLSGLTAYNVPNLEKMVSTVTSSQPSRGIASESFNKSFSQKKVTKQVDECAQMDAIDIKILQDDMRKYLMDFHFSFRDQVIKTASRLNASVAIQPDPVNDSARFRLATFNIIDDRLQLEQDLEAHFNDYYNNILSSKKYKLVINCGYLRAADSMLTSYKKGFNAFLNVFDSAFNEAKMVALYKEITKPKPPAFIRTFPYLLTADITNLDIEVIGIDPSKTPQNYAASIQINKYPDRLWGFSTGVYVGGLFNRNYSILTNTAPNNTVPGKVDTLNYSIVENTPDNKMEAGINALMHIGTYFKESNWGIAFTFGPALSLEKNPKPRIILGLSAVSGRTNKLMFSTGWMGGSITSLTSAYNTTDTYNPAPTNITTDRFKGQWFFSSGYGIFGK